MITLTIDGQLVQAEEGQTILEVCRKNSIDIPTLCYHPVLEPFGACRLCTVEIVQGARAGLQTACTYPVVEGLEVSTSSPSVVEARRMILGLLLSRCPNVPVIQDLALEYGIKEPPFPTDHPEEDCILCGLCVRACHELVKAGAINFADRGVDRVIGPPFMEKTRDCIGCGACTIVCPTGAIRIVLEKEAVYLDKPLGPTSAIYVPSLQAVPRVPVIDTDTFIRFRQQDRTNGEISDACGACQMVCEAGAIDFTRQAETVELDVGTIVVATGFEMWDPTQLSQYSYGRSPNIITGLEFERLSNAAGITGGQIVLADGRKPERAAVIHCVGSRDHNAHEYCSRICCMYSLKQAHLVKDKTGAEVYEFYMDMRSFGKGYEEFYERIQEEGVTMVRGRGAEVNVLENGKLRVKGEDANLGRVVSVDVDMVVLSTAIQAPQDAGKVASLFGLSRSPDGFFAEAHPKLRPVETNTAGVFVAGACQSPRDIPDAVAMASATSAKVLGLFSADELEREPAVAVVSEQTCIGCMRCALVCPYGAIEQRDICTVDGQVCGHTAYVNPGVCQGCGTCEAVCLSNSVELQTFTDEQVYSEINALCAWE
jgi:heterodisulfide reductase subunit A